MASARSTDQTAAEKEVACWHPVKAAMHVLLNLSEEQRARLPDSYARRPRGAPGARARDGQGHVAMAIGIAVRASHCQRADHVRHLEQIRSRATCHLLRHEWLTPEQCVQYKRLGYFEVRGSHSRKRYRIRSARQLNVDLLDEHGRTAARLCFLPEKYVPVRDIMLAQKIMLENDEPAALRVAIRH